MKQVPYKCRFGHITIKRYYNDSTKGTVECEECAKFVGEYVSMQSANKRQYYDSFVRAREMAVRI